MVTHEPDDEAYVDGVIRLNDGSLKEKYRFFFSQVLKNRQSRRGSITHARQIPDGVNFLVSGGKYSGTEVSI